MTSSRNGGLLHLPLPADACASDDVTAFAGRGYDTFNISKYNLFDSYLPQYEIAFKEGKASGAMCSYNGTQLQCPAARIQSCALWKHEHTGPVLTPVQQYGVQQ